MIVGTAMCQQCHIYTINYYVFSWQPFITDRLISPHALKYVILMN